MAVARAIVLLAGGRGSGDALAAGAARADVFDAVAVGQTAGLARLAVVAAAGIRSPRATVDATTTPPG